MPELSQDAQETVIVVVSAGDFSKEAWLWKSYGEGIRDALKLQPERRFRLIHRYHQTGQTEILDAYCRILLLARSLGPVRTLSAGQVAELLALKRRLGFEDPRVGQ